MSETQKPHCPECEDGDDGQTLFVHSIAARTADGIRGFVHLAFRGARVQLDPEQARAHAWALMQCAEAAISDEAIVRLAGEMDLGEESATRLLIALRNARQRREH